MAKPADASPAKQLSAFIAKFDPAIATRIRECRAFLRKRLPTANELVYDNYNFFVIGYCAAENASSCIVSLVSNAKGLGLSFYYGVKVRDPHKLLQGSGSQNRFIRLPEGASTLAQPEIQNLIDNAIAVAKVPLAKSGKGQLIIRCIAPKQRPRRQAKSS